MAITPAIVWLRRDLRLDDQPTLLQAAERGGPVLPVFIWSPRQEGEWSAGAASRWWLHRSLKILGESLRSKGSRLILRRGEPLAVLKELASRIGAGAVLWSRRYEPAEVAREARMEQALRGAGLQVETCNAALLFEPWQAATRKGAPYRMFTPFWTSCRDLPPPAEPRAAPDTLAAPARWPDSLALDELALDPGGDIAAGLRAAWRPGEAGARERLEAFLGGALQRYHEDRDRPDREGGSRLSPHLHFGEVGPRRLWQMVRARSETSAGRPGAEAYLRQLGWREFAHHLLFHFPHTPAEPLREAFVDFPWRTDEEALQAWRRGRTGYPFVDAGMRQLGASGWMHNRVRMVVASFLVKDLRISWQAGARWFWETLVDADLANNTLGWQWTAGCGADAAPYFRIFNPVRQGERHDPDGDYVRRWVPELEDLPGAWIHRPWEAPDGILRQAGVELGNTYPHRLVDHGEARECALQAYERIRGS